MGGIKNVRLKWPKCRGAASQCYEKRNKGNVEYMLWLNSDGKWQLDIKGNMFLFHGEGSPIGTPSLWRRWKEYLNKPGYKQKFEATISLVIPKNTIGVPTKRKTGGKSRVVVWASNLLPTFT